MTADELIKKVESIGWRFEREGKGSHRIYKHAEYTYHISIPYHKGKDMGKGLVNKILKDAGLK